MLNNDQEASIYMMNTLVRCGREEKYHYLHNNGDSFQENVHSFNLIYIDCSFLYFLFSYNLKVHVVYIFRRIFGTQLTDRNFHDQHIYQYQLRSDSK